MSAASAIPCLSPLVTPPRDLDALLAQARWAADITAKQIPIYIREYLDTHKRLAALQDACGYRLFAANTLAANRVLEKDVGEGLRECLAEVMALQRKLKKWMRLVKLREKEEKKLHRECMKLFREIAEKKATEKRGEVGA